MPPKPILEFAALPTEVVADIEAIRKVNPQRHEMELLTAVTLLDKERGIAVAYKDIGPNEFWIRGHMPDFPLMPGVLMIEAAAQLGAYYCKTFGIFPDADFIGLGGMNDVRMRGIVRPGDRLWIVGKEGRFNPRMMIFSLQGFVEGKMVFEVEMLGVPMKSESPRD